MHWLMQVEWLPCSALVAWGACARILSCDKANYEANVACLHLKAYTQALKSSSLLSTVLEASTGGEGF